jgi:outer membrane protein insertion porin family
MGLKVSAGVDVYHRIVDENSSNFYGSTATGGQVRFGAPVTRDLSATVFVGGETKSFVDANAPVSTVAGPLNGVTKNKIWVGYSLVYNGVDDIKHPTEGLYATFSQQYMGLDYSLLRTEAKARYYFPIAEDQGIIGSVRAQAGIVNALGGTVSPLEAWQVGPSLVRGFQARELGPRIATGEVTGTTMYAGISGEIEFPIPVVPESYGLKGAIWADAAWIDGIPDLTACGACAVVATSVDQPLKSSVGASIIWDGPFGPLRGDVGYVITKATDDRTQIFQLTIQNLL